MLSVQMSAGLHTQCIFHHNRDIKVHCLGYQPVVPRNPDRLVDGFTYVQVHSYVAVPGGRTAYLAELHSGSEVLVADAKGRTQTALVGRCKIERRPLVCARSLVVTRSSQEDVCQIHKKGSQALSA